MTQAVDILRTLWRHRLLVALVAIAAVLVSLMLTYRVSWPPKSREHEVGIATAHVLVDTPHSQVVNIATAGSETLVVRASLLAYLMTEGDLKAAIARRAGMQPEQVIGVAEVSVGSQADASKAQGGTETPAPTARLTTRLVTAPDTGTLPIIEIEAEAPDTRRAARLANAAVDGLGAYLDSEAAVEDVSDRRRLRVTGLGPAQAHAAVRGPQSVFTFGAGIFVFLSGCAIILLSPALARAWRAAAELDESDDVVHYGQFLRPLDESRIEPLAASGTEAPGSSTSIMTPTPRRVRVAQQPPDDGTRAP